MGYRSDVIIALPEKLVNEYPLIIGKSLPEFFTQAEEVETLNKVTYFKFSQVKWSLMLNVLSWPR